MINVPLPTFKHPYHKLRTDGTIRNSEWMVIEVDDSCRLIVKNSTIVIRYGTKNDLPIFQQWADIHNTNLLMGISDESYNSLIVKTFLSKDSR